MIRSTFVVLFLFAMSASYAQVETAHLNTGLILESLPESAVADSLLAQYQDSLQTVFVALEGKFNTSFQNARDSVDLLTPNALKQREASLMKLQQEMQMFQESGANLFQQRRAAYLTPLVDRVQAGIEAYAKANNIKLIFDVSVPGAMVFVDETKDITDAVIASLKSE